MRGGDPSYLCVRGASQVLAVGAWIMVMGMDNRDDDGRKSGVDKWSKG